MRQAVFTTNIASLALSANGPEPAQTMYLSDLTLKQLAVFEPFQGLVVFAVSLPIGGAAIHVAAKHAVHKGKPDGMTFERAIVTALLGVVVWVLLEWVPLVGSLLALVGWSGVIRW